MAALEPPALTRPLQVLVPKVYRQSTMLLSFGDLSRTGVVSMTWRRHVLRWEAVA